MDVKASKYLVVETAASCVVNGILNYASAYALFHGRSVVPATGSGSLLIDSVGETFIVTFLSALIPSLTTRHRRRAGTLPIPGDRQPTPAGNLYVRAIVTGLIFTCIFVPCNALLFPRMFPDGVSLHHVLLFKTVYGAVIGAIATFLAIHRALYEDLPVVRLS